MDGLRRLEGALGAPVAAGVEALDDDELAELAELVQDARAAHIQVMRDASDRALSHVPRLLRPAVRRVLGG